MKKNIITQAYLIKNGSWKKTFSSFLDAASRFLSDCFNGVVCLENAIYSFFTRIKYCVPIILCLMLASWLLGAAQTEFGVDDDLTVKGIDGSFTDADVEIAGFTTHGSTGTHTPNIDVSAGSIWLEGGIEALKYSVFGSSVVVKDTATVHGFGIFKSSVSIPEHLLMISGGAETDVLTRDSNGGASWSSAVGDVGGTGTQYYIPIWTGTKTLGDSVLFQNAGNVGIGITSPAARLHVSSDSAVASDTVFQVSSGPAVEQALFVIKGDGKIGIGTTSPERQLVVVEDGSDGLFIKSSNSADCSTLGFGVNTTSGFSYIQSRQNGSGTIQPLSFWVGGNGRSMDIIPGGNVGIGTTAPDYKLDVAGAVNTSTRYQIAGDTVIALTGNQSLNVGVNAGRVNTGNYNVFVGSAAGYSNTSGANNSFVGYQAGYLNTTSGYNSLMGYKAGYNNTGQQNSFLGYEAGYSNTGVHNSFVGHRTGYSNTGQYNSFLGSEAGYSNTSGANNSFLGYRAGYNNINGNNNSIVGYQACYFTRTGSANAILGHEAGYGAFNKSFSNSTLVGYRAGYILEEGSDNIFLGWKAGDNLTTGSRNIILGYDIDARAVDSANTLNIGNLIFATGVDGIGTTLSSGNVGISTTVPTHKLSVEGGIVATSSITASAFYGDGTGLTGLSSGIQADDDVYWEGIHAWKSSATFEHPAFSIGTSTFVVKAGNVGIGTTDPKSKLHVVGDNIAMTRYTDTTSAPVIRTQRARNTIGSPNVVQNGDLLGGFNAQGWSAAANNWVTAAGVNFEVDGTPDSGGDPTDMPGRITFKTCADGTDVFTEAMRIDDEGNVGIGITNPGSYYPPRFVVSDPGGPAQGLSIVSLPTDFGNISFADGTNGAEKYMGSIRYYHGDDRLFFGAGGQAEIMTLKDGKVGIGDSDPDAVLEISEEGTTPFMISNGDSGDGDFMIVTTDGNVGIGTTTPGAKLHTVSSTTAYSFVASSGTDTGSYHLVVSTMGNVGIGTTDPGLNKLEVVGGPIKATGGLIIETRTDAPGSPVDGQIWLRTDL